MSNLCAAQRWLCGRSRGIMHTTLATLLIPPDLADVPSTSPVTVGDGFAATFDEAPAMPADSLGSVDRQAPTDHIPLPDWLVTGPRYAIPVSLAPNRLPTYQGEQDLTSDERDALVWSDPAVTEAAARAGGDNAAHASPVVPEAFNALTDMKACHLEQSTFVRKSDVLVDHRDNAFDALASTQVTAGFLPVTESEEMALVERVVGFAEPSDVNEARPNGVSAERSGSMDDAVSWKLIEFSTEKEQRFGAINLERTPPDQHVPGATCKVADPAEVLAPAPLSPKETIEVCEQALVPRQDGKESSPSATPPLQNSDRIVPSTLKRAAPNSSNVVSPVVENQSSQVLMLTSFWESFFGDAAETVLTTQLSGSPELRLALAETRSGALPLASLENMPATLLSLVTSEAQVVLHKNPKEPSVRSGSFSDAEVPQTLDTASPRWQTQISSIMLLGWSEKPAGHEEWSDTLAMALPTGPSIHASNTVSKSEILQSVSFSQIASQVCGIVLQASDNSTVLALAPDELGKIRLSFEPDVNNPDRMVVMISVERPETLDLFRRHAGELAEAIRNAGYSETDIGFNQHGTDGQKHQQNAQRSGQRLSSPEQSELSATLHRPTIGASLDLRL
jgi:hypothetical protein